MSDFKNHRVNGCEPSGTVRENRSPSGRITRRQGTTDIEDSAGNVHELHNEKCLLAIKGNSRRMFKMFRSFCEKHNIEFKEPQKPIPVVERFRDVETGEFVYDEQPRDRTWNVEYECKGPLCFLRQLAKLECCVRGTLVLSVGAPHFSSGERFVRSVSVRTPLRELFAGCKNVFVK